MLFLAHGHRKMAGHLGDLATAPYVHQSAQNNNIASPCANLCSWRYPPHTPHSPQPTADGELMH